MRIRTGLSLAVAILPMAMLGAPYSASADHVVGFTISLTSINHVSRAVGISATESTDALTIHDVNGCAIQVDLASSTSHAWTSTTLGPPNVYKFAMTHVYPDLKTRTITGTSDCCASGSVELTDTAVVDFACTDTPIVGCRDGGKHQLQIKNNATDAKDQLKWKWLNGAPTELTDLGNPMTAMPYFFCVYDPALALQALVPPSATNWKEAGEKGFKFKDKSGANGGITQIGLKVGGEGKAKVQVKAGGASMDDPLPLVQPVTVQLQNADGECWGHTFTAPETASDADQFSDKE